VERWLTSRRSRPGCRESLCVNSRPRVYHPCAARVYHPVQPRCTTRVHPRCATRGRPKCTSHRGPVMRNPLRRKARSRLLSLDQHLLFQSATALGPVAGASDYQDLRVVGQPIQAGAGQQRIAKEVRPLAGGAVAREQDAPPLVALETPTDKTSCWMTLTNNASRLPFRITPSMVNP